MRTRCQREHCETDVLVIGGGPAGCALAVAAAASGLSVVVLERSQYEAPRVGEHLTPDAQPTLAALGVLDRIHAGRHRRCAGVRCVWGDETLYDRDYLFNVSGHGWNLDREQFDIMLAETATRAGAEVLTGTQLAACSACGSGWTAQLRGGLRHGQTIKARFLVDATGRAATVARRLGSQRRALDKLVALCAWLPSAKPARGHPERLLIEAIETGWWYTTQISGDRSVAVFLSDRDLVPSGAAGAINEWTEKLTRTRHVKTLIELGAPATVFRSRAADSYILDPVAGEHWLAVGDAAAAYDPLSSVGILKALRHGIAAACTIARALAGDRGAWSAHMQAVNQEFARYVAERQFYYASEKRWPDQPFWRRRRVAQASATRSE